jgi:CubicO group peptidase (beta-lactamase class C family)
MYQKYSSFNLDPNSPPSNDPHRNPFADDASNAEFDKRVADAMAYWHVPGLAVAIIDNHHVTCRGYGVARLSSDEQRNESGDGTQSRIGEGGAFVTPKTLFNCASMSKSFTAAAMALLVEDDERVEVKWQTPVSKLCEDFVFAEEAMTKEITVEDILCHRTGLSGYVLWPFLNAPLS